MRLVAVSQGRSLVTDRPYRLREFARGGGNCGRDVRGKADFLTPSEALGFDAGETTLRFASGTITDGPGHIRVAIFLHLLKPWASPTVASRG